MNLNEGYINIIGSSNRAKQLKEEYVDEVWEMLQNSYASIGGIKGSGFENKERMIDHVPFWKMVTDSEDNIKAIMMYKDNSGRKRVAIATDGTPEGKDVLAKMFRKEYERAYSEQSGPSLRFVIKVLGMEFIKKYIIPRDMVSDILESEVLPYTGGNAHIPADLEEYAYIRNINGEKIAKIMLGTIGNKIGA